MQLFSTVVLCSTLSARLLPMTVRCIQSFHFTINDKSNDKHRIHDHKYCPTGNYNAPGFSLHPHSFCSTCASILITCYHSFSSKLHPPHTLILYPWLQHSLVFCGALPWIGFLLTCCLKSKPKAIRQNLVGRRSLGSAPCSILLRMVTRALISKFWIGGPRCVCIWFNLNT